MDRVLIDSLFLILLGLFDFCEVLVGCIWSFDSLRTFWCYGKTLGNFAVISVITALELELWVFEVDLDAMFSEPSVSQKDGCVSEFHNI